MNLEKDLFFLSPLDELSQEYLQSPLREVFFEIVWLQDEKPLHFIKNEAPPAQGDWMYLIPPSRTPRPSKSGHKGVLIAFHKSVLDYEVQEFSMDVYRLFFGKGYGNFSTMLLEAEASRTLGNMLQVMQAEYENQEKNFLILRALLKAFLLKLIQYKSLVFTGQDLQEKRVHHFLLLLEHHFREEKSVEFYADKLNVTAKRLNQILKKKLGKTITQLLQERLLQEARHELIISKQTIKEIAYALGFEDNSYFSRFFRKKTGLTPEQFQKQAKAKVSVLK